MKKIFILLIGITCATFIFAQDLPKDVAKVYKGAEHLKSKKKLNEAVAAYKEVIRSVNHVPSMVSIANIEMNMRKPPNYRAAYEYYDMAIKELESQIATASKNKDKAKFAKQREGLIPRRNKAKSFVDDFDKAKDLKKGGSRLLEDEDL